MSKLNDTSITIYEALQNIENGKYVMPAFQRQYVWSMEQIEKLNYSYLPVCIAKTQYSFSDDPKNLECNEPFTIHISEVELKAGAEFIVVKTGKIIERKEVPNITEEQIKDVLQNFLGKQMQTPPIYSSIKINGKKAYEYARSGQTIEIPAREIEIMEISLLNFEDNIITFKVSCSKGTYIRTLCHDIGQALGCGGCMASLRRTMAAGYTLDESHTLEQVQAQGEALLRPVDTLFRQHPAYHITHPRVEQLCRNGNAFTVKTPLDGGIYRVYGTEGDFLCLSRLENGQMTSIKNFFGA